MARLLKSSRGSTRHYNYHHDTSNSYQRIAWWNWLFFSVLGMAAIQVLTDQSSGAIVGNLLRSTSTTLSSSRLTSAIPDTTTTNTANKNPITMELATQLATAKDAKRDFLEIATKTTTDKVWGHKHLPACLQDPAKCRWPEAQNPKCRVAGHFYHTLYNQWLGRWAEDKFQFLEVGFYHGMGYDAYKEFLPNAETHSMEISCLPEGPRNEGKWPWGNFAAKNPHYQTYIDNKELHCGDASSYEFLHHIWTTQMKRPDAPPLKVVIDDAAHLAQHMATTLFFWFPRIAPGGVLIVEDIQPIKEANAFRTHVLPQVMKDLHYCGNPNFKEQACFPTIWPLLQSVHCEMHICVFERNDQPAVEYNETLSMPPPHALDASKCLFG